MGSDQDEQQFKTNRFGLGYALLAGVLVAAIVFLGFALRANYLSKHSDSPEGQIQTYLNYLGECITNLRELEKRGGGATVTPGSFTEALLHTEAKEIVRHNRSLPKEQQKDPGREARMVILACETGIPEKLIEKYVDDLDKLAVELAKTRLFVESTVQRTVAGGMQVTPDARRALETAKLDNFKFEDRGVEYYLEKDAHAMVRVPVTAGAVAFAILALAALQRMFVKRAVVAASGGQTNGAQIGTILFPWRYPHLGWRRLSFVFSPVFALLVFYLFGLEHWELKHQWEEKALPLAITAFFLGAPGLLMGREISEWVKRGFGAESQQAEPRKKPE